MGFDHSRTKSQEKTVEDEGWLIFLSALIDCSSWLLWVAHYSKDEDLFVLVFLGAFEWVEHRNHFKAKLTCEILSSGRDMSCPCCDLLKIVVIFVSITSYEFDGWYLVNVSPMSFYSSFLVLVFTEVVMTVSDDQSGSLHPYQKAAVWNDIAQQTSL